ncbi:MAG: hypothetical protein ING31_06845 [Burkholderiales bacterium]|nr:hypothetical protein [Burkholderiales bacterium]
MNYTLLELIQQVTGELGLLPSPSVVVGNTDPQVVQLLALANRLGRDISRQYEWQKLNKEYSFTTVQGQSQYALPVDWLRQIPQTEWDRTSRWPLIGPATTQEWQIYKSAIISQGPNLRFRIANNFVEVDPATGGLDLSFFYVSKNWIDAGGGVYRYKYQADTDVSMFDDSLMLTGLKVQWKAAKGLDASFDVSEFRAMFDTIKAQDKSAQKLSLGSFPRNILLTEWNIQDGNFPG